MMLDGGLTGLLIGPPGTGKSTALGSALEVEGINHGILLAAKARERHSYKYREHRDRLTVETFSDPGWAPSINKFEAGAFTRLFERVLSLYEDDTEDVVLVDPFTDITYMAARELLAPEQAGTPRDLRDSIGFYGSLKYKMKDFTQSLVGLAAAGKRPKHVFVAVHAQPTKEEDMKGKQTPEGSAKGVEFMGEALPMIEGSYRREIAGEFDLVGFTSLSHKRVREGNTMKSIPTYQIQLHADSERHAKLALLPRGEEKMIGNSLVEVFELIQGGGK